MVLSHFQLRLVGNNLGVFPQRSQLPADDRDDLAGDLFGSDLEFATETQSTTIAFVVATANMIV